MVKNTNDEDGVPVGDTAPRWAGQFHVVGGPSRGELALPPGPYDDRMRALIDEAMERRPVPLWMPGGGLDKGWLNFPMLTDTAH